MKGTPEMKAVSSPLASRWISKHF